MMTPPGPSIEMPQTALPSGTVPLASVPMELLCTTKPRMPAPVIWMPSLAFPEISLPDAAVAPPIVAPIAPDARTPEPLFGTAFNPFWLTPIRLPATYALGEVAWSTTP